MYVYVKEGFLSWRYTFGFFCKKDFIEKKSDLLYIKIFLYGDNISSEICTIFFLLYKYILHCNFLIKTSLMNET